MSPRPMNAVHEKIGAIVDEILSADPKKLAVARRLADVVRHDDGMRKSIVTEIVKRVGRLAPVGVSTNAEVPAQAASSTDSGQADMEIILAKFEADQATPDELSQLAAFLASAGISIQGEDDDEDEDEADG